MGKIKGWKKSKKYDGSNPAKMLIYQSEKTPRETWVTIGLVGRTSQGYFAITDTGSQASFEYKNYDIALKDARKYMRSHPNG